MAERKFSRYPREGSGDVFRDRLIEEWPRLWGGEVSDEEYEEWLKRNS